MTLGEDTTHTSFDRFPASSADTDQQGWACIKVDVSVLENQPPQITTYLPETQSVVLNAINTQQTFSVAGTDPDGDDSQLVTTWFVDGKPVGYSSSFDLAISDLEGGAHVVMVLLDDGNKYARKIWNVDVDSTVCSYVEIQGMSEVIENSSNRYQLVAHYSDGTQRTVDADRWSENSDFREISVTGELTTTLIGLLDEVPITLMADYTEYGAVHQSTFDLRIFPDFTLDSDGDGLLDGTEIGMTSDGISTDTDLNFFIPDLDPSTTTNPMDYDTDNDGVPDGDKDKHHNGNMDAGESSPCNPDTDSDGYSDLQEHLNRLAGETDPLGGVYDPQVANAPGGTGYNPGSSNSNFWNLMLPAILGGNR